MSQAIVEPIHVRVSVGTQITGESRTALYAAIARGELSAFKQGPFTLLDYQQLKDRCAARQPVKLKERPHLAAARDAYHARRKQQARKAKKAKRPKGNAPDG